MVRNIITGVLALVCIFLAYKVYHTIVDEIRYEKKLERVEKDVINRLKKVRTLELAYKDAKGEFAGKWSELTKFYMTDSLSFTKEFGDKDDSSSVYFTKTYKVAVKDTMLTDFPIDSLSIAPHSGGKQFIIAASTVTQNNVQVPVFEIKDPTPMRKERKKNDNPLKVGSLIEANYQGNWQ